jgi:hypothetical protein
MLIGNVSRVSAMGTLGGADSLANLSVNMHVSPGVLARWSHGPASPSSGARLLLRGSDGQLILDMPESFREWSLEIDGVRQTAEGFEIGDDHRRVLSTLELAMEGVEPEFSWADACRDMEVVSAVEQSLRRGRTIEVFEEEHSEEQTFKGIMAIGSCGILFASLLLLIGLAVFEGLTLPLRDTPLEIPDTPDAQPRRPHLLLRLWPFYPFAAFLLLQLLRLVFRSDTSTKPTSEPPAQSDDAAS